MQPGVSARIRVILIDDRVLFREALGQLCDADFGFEVTGQYLTLDEALPFLTGADVALIRGRLLEADRDMRGVRFLVIAETLDMDESFRTLRGGACGVVSKDTSPETVAAAVRHVASGGVWFDQQVIGALARRLTNGAGDPAAGLNDREQQVLAGVYAGLTDRAIAAGLGVKLGAVKSTVRRLRQRAGARTRGQLVRFFPSARRPQAL
jgi:DNA-binding NarL/FixJ family response regulator